MGEELEEVMECCVCGYVVSKVEMDKRLLELKRHVGTLLTTIYTHLHYHDLFITLSILYTHLHYLSH